MSDDPAAQVAAPSPLTAALVAGEQPKYPQLVVIVRDLAQRLEALHEQAREITARLADLAAAPAPAATQAEHATQAPLGDEYCPGCGSRLTAGHFEGCPNDTEESRDG